MRRSLTLPVIALALALAAAGCGEGEPEGPSGTASPMATATTTVTETVPPDDADAAFTSATASVDVQGDVDGSLSLTELRDADIAGGLFTATIASDASGAVLEVAAPADTGAATTGAGGVALRLDIADPDRGEVHTFVAGDGTCTITMAPGETAVNGTFECSGMTSEDGQLTIDASGSFAVTRG